MTTLPSLSTPSASFTAPEMPFTTKIALLPAGTIDVASSRLRCIGLAQALQFIGYDARLGAEFSHDADVLFVQKRVNRSVLSAAKAVKARGGRVMYDVDDHGDALKWVETSPRIRAEFMRHCDVICVDTEIRRDVFAKDPAYAEIPEWWVVPDPIDYIGFADNPPAPPRDIDASSGLVACWFGNAPNITPAIPYLEAAHRNPAVRQIDVISNRNFMRKLTRSLPYCNVTAWDLKSFPARLRTSDFCLLIHDASIDGIQKSNNKMLAALALGVIPFASRSPSYEATATRMGLEGLLLDCPDDLQSKLSPSNIAALRAAMEAPRCQDELALYSPHTIALGLSRRLERLLSQPAYPVRSGNTNSKRSGLGSKLYDACRQRIGTLLE